MLINATEQLARDSFFKAVETNNQEIVNALRQYDHAVLIGDENDPTDIMQRMGKCLSSAEVKTRLEKLSHYVRVEKHPKNPKMWVVYSIRGGSKKYVSAFEDGIVPERTVMNTRTIEDVDPASLNPNWKPKKLDAPRVDINGIIQIDENESKPGITRYTIPWHIERMGYRTILIRLIQERIARLDKVEELFGNDNTPEWAAKTGQRNDIGARF
jgi:hypothetical protein